MPCLSTSPSCLINAISKIMIKCKNVLLVFLLAFSFFCAELTQANEIKQRLPNIVLLYADDMGYGDLGIQNPNSKIPTPHLDKLALQGMRFTDAHSSSSICSPSRYAILTGRYHWKKTDHLINEMGDSVFDRDRLTLPKMLREAGYATGCVGKWHLGFGWLQNVKPDHDINKHDVSADTIDWSLPAPGGPTNHGFDYYFGEGTPNFPPYGFVENDRMIVAPTIQVEDLGEGNHYKPGPAVVGWKFDQVMPTLTQKAVEWIGKQKGSDKPFFLYFPFTSPHAPIVPVPPFVGTSQAGLYGDYVVQSDWTAGQVLKALEDNGFSENTIVIFTSDNGPAGTMQTRYIREGHNSSYGLRGMKIDILEGGHRVPFIIRWPGITKSGSVSEGLISQIDIMATLAKALGYELPADQAEDSIDFMPILKGEKSKVRSGLIYNNKEWGIRDGDWVFLKQVKAKGKKEYLESIGCKPFEKGEDVLFNLGDDLMQRTNVLTQHPEVAKQLRLKLQLAQKQSYRYLKASSAQ